MAKAKSELIKNLKLTAPDAMEYTVNISNAKDRQRFIERVKKVIRRSQEYKDYIQFLKEHIGLNSCIFFQKVTNGPSSKKGRISIEMHHEPFTLQDYVDTVINKFQDQGLPLNDLLIADEVMELHYSNKVGLVPLSKTAHQMVHKSTKVVVPLNMCYGKYSEFLEEYEPYISEDMYTKLEKKIDMTNNLTPESFDAITKQFTYLDVKGFEDIEKMEVKAERNIA